MPTSVPAAPPGWPFFAPSDDQAVARAFELAGLAAGEHLVDLGCGDGKVLVAAARLGAVVTGIESDEDLAADARAALRAAGVADRGRVLTGDLFEPELLTRLAPPPDVLFTYLSPATLQRLTPILRRLPGARLVTVDYAVPDLIADAADDPPPTNDAEPGGSPSTRTTAAGGAAPHDHAEVDDAAAGPGHAPDHDDADDAASDGAVGSPGHDVDDVAPGPVDSAATNGSARLYRLPGRRRPAQPAQVGWPSAGTLCVQPTEVASLTCLEAVHPGGPVDVQLTGDLTEHASSVAGLDRVDPGRTLAIDLRWQPRPPGTVAQGAVHVTGLAPHPLTVVFADDDQGQWDLSDEGCTTLATHLRTHPHPTPQELLTALDP